MTASNTAAVPEDRVRAAARLLSDRSAEFCGANKDDNWKIYSEDFVADVRAILPALSQPAAAPLGDQAERIAELEKQVAIWRAEADKAVAWLWREGEPPFPWSQEWFVAETIYGERVVLRALPEEHTYDYKTADETYMARRNIKRWAQFPDSEYFAAPGAEVAPADLAGSQFAAKSHLQTVQVQAECIKQADAVREQLVAALSGALSVIQDYLEYEHNGDPWTEDARAMGEIDIDDYQRDGRLEAARAALAATGVKA